MDPVIYDLTLRSLTTLAELADHMGCTGGLRLSRKGLTLDAISSTGRRISVPPQPTSAHHALRRQQLHTLLTTQAQAFFEELHNHPVLGANLRSEHPSPCCLVARGGDHPHATLVLNGLQLPLTSYLTTSSQQVAHALATAAACSDEASAQLVFCQAGLAGVCAPMLASPGMLRALAPLYQYDTTTPVYRCTPLPMLFGPWQHEQPRDEDMFPMLVQALDDLYATATTLSQAMRDDPLGSTILTLSTPAGGTTTTRWLSAGPDVRTARGCEDNIAVTQQALSELVEAWDRFLARTSAISPIFGGHDTTITTPSHSCTISTISSDGSFNLRLFGTNTTTPLTTIAAMAGKRPESQPVLLTPSQRVLPNDPTGTFIATMMGPSERRWRVEEQLC